MNPVRARLVERAEDWPWSSVRAHLAGRDEGLVEVAPLISRCVGRFADLIVEEADAARVAALRAAETIGRPLRPPAFLDRLAAQAASGRRGLMGRALCSPRSKPAVPANFHAVPPAAAIFCQRLEFAMILAGEAAADAASFGEIRCFCRCYQQIRPAGSGRRRAHRPLAALCKRPRESASGASGIIIIISSKLPSGTEPACR